MPPKRKSRVSKVEPAPQLIPIYQLLLNTQINNPSEKIIHLLQKSLEEDRDNGQTAVISIQTFILKLCGLGDLSSRVQWKQRYKSLSGVLFQIYEEPSLAGSKNELILIDIKHQNHSLLKKRLGIFLNELICHNCQNLFKIELLEKLCYWLELLCTSKLRQIRASSLQFCQHLLERLCDFYNQQLDRRNSRQANYICKIIDLYIEKIIKGRIKDIDKKIRSSLFDILTTIFKKIGNQFIDKEKLEDIYTPILNENTVGVVENSLKSLAEIYQYHQKSNSKALIEYGKKTLDILQEFSLLPSQVGQYALRILLAMHKMSNKSGFLKIKLISKAFQIYGCQEYRQGLEKLIEIFLNSLSVNYQALDTKLILIQIMNLLAIVNVKKFSGILIGQFIKHHRKLFKIDEMLLLLFTQFYNNGDEDIHLKQSQLQSLLLIIIQWTKIVKAPKLEDTESPLQVYNNFVINNCKEILLSKIIDHEQIAYLYLNIISRLFIPINTTLVHFLDFIMERIAIVFQTSLDSKVIQQCVQIVDKLKSHNISMLLEKLQLQNFKRNQIRQDQIMRVSCIFSKHIIEDMLQSQILHNLLSYFQTARNDSIKMEICSIAFATHFWLFGTLMKQANTTIHKKYLQCRQLVLRFLFSVLSQHSSESTVVKLAAFSCLCKVLKLCCNGKILDLPIIYYEITNQQLLIILKFLQQNLKRNHDQSVVEQQISILLGNLSFEENQVRNLSLQNMIELLQNCPKITSHEAVVSFLIDIFLDENNKNHQNLVTKLLNKYVREQGKQANKSKFIFWRVMGEVINIVNQTEKQQKIVTMFVDCYFKKKQNPNVRKILLDKLILFLADSIDRYINRNQFSKLASILIILKKHYRKYTKNVLHRLLLFLNNKIENKQQHENLTSLKKFLEKISKTNEKKQAENDQQDQQEQKQHSEREEENQSDNEQQIQEREKKNTRVTRSITKKGKHVK